MRTININSFYNYLGFISSKTISGGFISPNNFNNSIKIVLNNFVRKYRGIPEQPQVAYERSYIETDYIGHLKKEKILSIADNGQATKPSDFMFQSSVYASVITVKEADQDTLKCCDTSQVKKATLKKMWQTMVPVTPLSDNEVASWQSNSLREPTKEDPVCTFKGDTIQFFPRDLRSSYLSYIRYPLTPFWNYTGSSYPVYNPAGSTDIELPEVCADELMAMMLERLGMVIREEGLINFARYLKQSGV